MSPFRLLLVLLKLFKCRVLHVPTASFCKRCGRDVRDFIAPDEIWDVIDPHIRFGHTLCYSCFCDLCSGLDLPPVWGLVELPRH